MVARLRTSDGEARMRVGAHLAEIEAFGPLFFWIKVIFIIDKNKISFP